MLVDGAGTPVLLLHGFPDSSHLWRHQIPALVAAGFRTITPDLRGFGESEKPPAIEDYAMTRSIADMLAVLDALELERAHIVGHDFGAGLAWALAALVPERVDRLVIMSVGHPNSFRPPSIAQREKFWYQLLFQFEDIAEPLIQHNRWRLFREMFRGAQDLEQYIADLSRPGALTAALGWYRANAAPAKELKWTRSFPAVAAPTLGIWSTGDNYLLEEGMTASTDHVTGPWRYERVEGAGHWLQLDAPTRVNELLLEFLA